MNALKSIQILKADGSYELFQPDKIIASLERAGASRKVAKEILEEIGPHIKDGASTKTIYKHAKRLLRSRNIADAGRYNLKAAILELGQTGYPFEKFVAELLMAEGFETKVGEVVKGKCVNHEIDVIASKENLHFMCECKFHNTQGRHCNVKIPLYIQSRFIDVEEQWRKHAGHKSKFHQGWIFTNTRFTSDAIQFGECVGLKLISWGHPVGEGIKDRVSRTGVYPITCLTTIKKKEKSALIKLDVVSCYNLCQQPEVLGEVGIAKVRHKKILNESEGLCNRRGQISS